jgi:hypothetical protein
LVLENIQYANPEGYDTLLGEREVKLTRGQKQRLSIAMEADYIFVFDRNLCNKRFVSGGGRSRIRNWNRVMRFLFGLTVLAGHNTIRPWSISINRGINEENIMPLD